MEVYLSYFPSPLVLEVLIRSLICLHGYIHFHSHTLRELRRRTTRTAAQHISGLIKIELGCAVGSSNCDPVRKKLCTSQLFSCMVS
jgi:hypothetical protein